MNIRPLSYVEDDIEFPILTPNSFVVQQSNIEPELESHHIKDGDLRKRARYLHEVKGHVWKRWQREYLTSLRQRYQANTSSANHPEEGDIILIKVDEKNRNMWKMGKITKLIRGRDTLVRGVKLQCGKQSLERPIQLVYPSGLKCSVKENRKKLVARAKLFRPKRQAAAVAEATNKELVVPETEH